MTTRAAKTTPTTTTTHSTHAATTTATHASAPADTPAAAPAPEAEKATPPAPATPPLSTQLSNQLGTDADLIYANAQTRAAPSASYRSMTTTYIDRYDAPQTEAALTSVQDTLKDNGIDVPTLYSMIAEATQATSATTRLDNSARAARRRAAAINSKLKTYDARIAKLQATALPGSTVATALATIQATRDQALVGPTRTRRANRKAKVAAAEEAAASNDTTVPNAAVSKPKAAT